MSNRSFKLVLSLASLLCGAALSQVGRNYSLVMVGGGLDDNNTAIWDRIIELGGGKGVARMGVVASAGEVYELNIYLQYIEFTGQTNV